MHLLVTDSGLGGLSICAELERTLRDGPATRITYFNAWPEAERGYNDLPDIGSRARVFDRALAAMAATRPDHIVIACNTLSIVYEHTAFRRAGAASVLGIVDAGVGLFQEALAADAGSSLVLFGTRTTIESGEHRSRLLAHGIDSRRITAIACHGLAKAIETAPDGKEIRVFIDACTTLAREAQPPGDRVQLGVCCTHYTYVRDEMRLALEQKCGRPVTVLDPGSRLVDEAMRKATDGRPATPGLKAGMRPSQAVEVDVISKVEMSNAKRRSIARRVEAVSPATAAALLSYTRVADLF